MPCFPLGDRWVGDGYPTYFMAEIGSNHDGDLERAKDLIYLARDAGAEAVKFQNFHASQLISDFGFRNMQKQVSHQAAWKKSVFEVYHDAETPEDWTPILKEECDRAGVHFLSSPYDFDSIDLLEPFVPAYKVGSGDIDWLEALKRIAGKHKPVILSSGAANIAEVQRAVHTVQAIQPQVVLMQCNTNYTGSAENFQHVHLNVLRTYTCMFPDVILGLSDHTPGLSTCLGAVALGARMIEKHFTDDNSRSGPDHPYALSTKAFKEMVDRTRELEAALGSSEKFVAGNEQETVWIQRRCLRSANAILKGEILTRAMIDVLRPAAPGAILPPEIDTVVGKMALRDIPRGEALNWLLLGDATEEV